jgi:hypothetical protein
MNLSDHLSTEEFLTNLKMLQSEHSKDKQIQNLLDCVQELASTEKKIDKALSKKRTEIQEYLTFSPQDIFTTLRIFINSEWKPEGQGLNLHLNIFGKFIVNDDPEQLNGNEEDHQSKMKFIRIQNFVDLIRELRVDFLNYVIHNIILIFRKFQDRILTCRI